jgi:putative ABC transport system permease protein
VIACINYINLTIAYSASRLREIGIKKLIGANQFKLIRQLMGESGISLLIALILAVIFIEIMLPNFNLLVNRQLNVGYLENWEFYFVFISISLLIGFITGFIPAKIISGLQPLSLASKAPIKGKQGNLFRYSLVLFQFFISISLISCTVLISKQYHFLRNTNLGYDKDHVLTIGLNNPDVNKFRKFKTGMEKLAWIKYVGNSDYLPMSSTNYTGFTWNGAAPDEFLKMNINYVSPEFTDVYDIKLIKGNGFRPEMADQDQLYVLLNEKAITEIGWKDDPVGKEIIWDLDYRG